MKEDETPEGLARRASKGVPGNETLALDAVSEAVFRAFKGIKRLREHQYAETWFIRIVLNVAKDIKRRQKRELVMETVPEGAHYDNHGDMEFFALIESLQKELREIISLMYYSGYTLTEISEILRIPEGNEGDEAFTGLFICHTAVFSIRLSVMRLLFFPVILVFYKV